MNFDLFIGAVIGAIASGIAGYVRFQLEKRWERKFQAYEEIVRSLQRMRSAAETDEGSDPISVQSENWRDGKRDVEQAFAVGSLLISERAEMRLGKLINVLREPDYWHGRDFCDLDEAITEIKEIAKEDLGKSFFDL